VEVNGVGHQLPTGWVLFDDVSFRVGDGAKVALVGANGAGKTTLLRIVAGDQAPQQGSVGYSGGLGVMRQFIGTSATQKTAEGDEVGLPPGSTVRDLLVSVAPPRVRQAAAALDRAELVMMDRDDERTQLDYAHALADWGDAGGYDAEVLWDTCTVAALGLPYDRAQHRSLTTLSGGEQKRLALEALLRGPDEVLLLDEPDNYLDVPGKRWLEERLLESPKTVLFVSHDRELLARTAGRVVTVESGTAWVHPGGFATYHEARTRRHERLDELRRRWDEEHAKLKALVIMYRQKASYNADMASRLQAAVTRLERFEKAGPPEERPKEQNVRIRLRGGRTGLRALTVEQVELTGLMKPFSVEVFYGERVAVLGSNGSGKSHFLRLLAGWPRTDAVDHTGRWKLGARVVPGHFAQTHEHPELVGRTLLDILWDVASLRIEGAAPALGRYELAAAREQEFQTLSGGQQARFQILLLELAGSTMLLLDEPTDNLDLASAEALEDGLASYEGTVVAVTHDRWFARSFDRYLVFGADGEVYEAPEPVWDEGRVARAR